MKRWKTLVTKIFFEPNANKRSKIWHELDIFVNGIMEEQPEEHKKR